MRRILCALTVVPAVLASACTLPPPPGALVPPRVEVLEGDARAVRYGRAAAEVLRAPALAESVRALFGANWGAAGAGGRGVSAPAPEFFATAAGEPRVLRVGGTDWITVSGCRTGACATHAGVLLVRGDGAALLARLDDGGFSHDYAFGTGLVVTPEVQLHVDAAWRALGGPPRSR